MITDFNLQILIEPLLNWFAGHARVLPWREEPGSLTVEYLKKLSQVA